MLTIDVDARVTITYKVFFCDPFLLWNRPCHITQITSSTLYITSILCLLSQKPSFVSDHSISGANNGQTSVQRRGIFDVTGSHHEDHRKDITEQMTFILHNACQQTQKRTCLSKYLPWRQAPINTSHVSTDTSGGPRWFWRPG